MFKIGGRGYIERKAISFAPVSDGLLASINEVVIENASFAVKRD